MEEEKKNKKKSLHQEFELWVKTFFHQVVAHSGKSKVCENGAHSWESRGNLPSAPSPRPVSSAGVHRWCKKNSSRSATFGS